MHGTRDFSAFLTVPAAIRFMEKHNWPEKMKACRQLVIEHAPRFCKLMNATPLSPLTEEFVPQMFSIPIRSEAPEALQRKLYEHYKIEIPVPRLNDRLFIRYSINAFNTAADLDRLYDAMAELLVKEPKLLSRF
jgi:isopenicillin-N epimerase